MNLIRTDCTLPEEETPYIPKNSPEVCVKWFQTSISKDDTQARQAFCQDMMQSQATYGGVVTRKYVAKAYLQNETALSVHVPPTISQLTADFFHKTDPIRYKSVPFKDFYKAARLYIYD